MDAEARLNALAQHAPWGVLWLHPDGSVESANPAGLACLGAPDLPALNGKTLHGAEGLLPHFEALPTAVPSGAAPGHYSGPSAFRKHVDLEFWLHAIEAPPGKNGLWFFYCQDISERLRAEHSLAQREKLAALDGIIAGVAHELNNPMTAILGYTELLLGKRFEAPIHTKLSRIAQETERCRKIVGSMLTYAERNKAPMQNGLLNEALEEVIILSAYQLRVDDIEITYRLDPTVPTFPFQREPLQRAFLHIVNNTHLALNRHMDGERHLVVESIHQGDHVSLRFRDTGPGIAPHVLDKIFDPFFTTRGVGEGMGLGLSTTMGIIKDHGGQIWAESRAGEGATIVIELPYTFSPGVATAR